MDYRLYNPNYRDYPILLLSTVPVSDGQGKSGFSFLSMSRIYLAGTPPATVLAATSFVTTDPAAIMELSPTVTPRRMVELEPTHTFLPNRIGAGYITPRSSGALP